MVADLLCDRSDTAALLVAVGGDEHSGWRRLEDDLGRESRSRVLEPNRIWSEFAWPRRRCKMVP